MNEKTTKALYALLKELYKSPAAKDFVDVYERERRHEAQKRELSYEDFECLLNLAEAVRRKLLPDKVCDEKKHEARAVPVKWSVEKDNAYHALTEAIFKREPLAKIQAAAETFVDICHREEIDRKPKPDRAWSPEKAAAYNWLLTDFIRHKHYDEIVADARRLAAVCEREERVKPEVSDVYQDIFGNRYIVIGIHDSFPDGEPIKKPLILLARADGTSISDLFTVGLEEFMNPTFKKE